jgi:transposase
MNNELTEEQWQRLLPLLPLQKPSQGRPAKDHRTVVNAILWISIPTINSTACQ